MLLVGGAGLWGLLVVVAVWLLVVERARRDEQVRLALHDLTPPQNQPAWQSEIDKTKEKLHLLLKKDEEVRDGLRKKVIDVRLEALKFPGVAAEAAELAGKKDLRNRWALWQKAKIEWEAQIAGSLLDIRRRHGMGDEALKAECVRLTQELEPLARASPLD